MQMEISYLIKLAGRECNGNKPKMHDYVLEEILSKELFTDKEVDGISDLIAEMLGNYKVELKQNIMNHKNNNNDQTEI